MKTATKPDVFLSFSEIGKDKRTPLERKKDKSPEDIALHSLANTEGWKILKDYIKHLQKEMDELLTQLIASGGAFEDIGKITVVSNLAKEKLNAIITRVSDAEEELEG